MSLRAAGIPNVYDARGVSFLLVAMMLGYDFRGRKVVTSGLGSRGVKKIV